MMGDYFARNYNIISIRTPDLVKFLSNECSFHEWIRPKFLDRKIIDLIEEKLDLKLEQISYDTSTMMIEFRIV